MISVSTKKFTYRMQIRCPVKIEVPNVDGLSTDEKQFEASVLATGLSEKPTELILVLGSNLN